jgi:hypothetical protein
MPNGMARQDPCRLAPPLNSARQVGDRRHPEGREPLVTNDTHHLSNSLTWLSTQ